MKHRVKTQNFFSGLFIRTLIIAALGMWVLTGSFIYAAIPASERAALIALYNATGGDNWTRNSGWKEGTLEADGFGPIGSEDSWYGITAPRDYVSHIYLYGNQLNGTLPSDLADLTQLEVLDLADNTLSGTIPSSIGTISTLKELDLGTNELTGSCPSELGMLANLEELTLYHNQLSGTIPPSLGNLSRLNRLYLNENTFSGAIPSELGNLHELFDLELSHNELSGTIPSELANIGLDASTWKSINLEHNQLSGSVPGSFGNMTNVWLINLKGNTLSGAVPAELTKMIPQHSINLGYNMLFTDNQGVKDYLELYDPGWQWQTVAPGNLTVTILSAASLKLQWDAINYVWESGGYKVYYGLTENGPWTFAGMTPDKRTNFLEITGLTPGQRYYFTVNTQTDANQYNANTLVSDFSAKIWSYTLNYDFEINPPFGSFDTPLDQSTVSGSIAVTGWALDDSAVEHVKIYSESANGLVFIGDADLVDGARPDVAAVYPDYPNKNQAGWGYMLLTNFLPNNGNGAVVLHVIATDISGKTTDLGSKTIICDNAHSVEPFGAIDTPAQGGLVNGNEYINWGWALTPQPNAIPTDGSTISVWIDGYKRGTVTYDLYREDIATLFPGYANSSGAVGYFKIIPGHYNTGVHTIQWVVKDDAGHQEGIGSRYFTVSWHDASEVSNARSTASRPNAHQSLPIDRHSRVHIRKGYNLDIPFQTIQPDQSGTISIDIEPMQRLEIRFDGTTVSCPQLPTGSTITEEQAFVWQPGPGYMGVHRLLFVTDAENGGLKQKEIIVRIGLPGLEKPFSPDLSLDRSDLSDTSGQPDRYWQ